MQSPWKAAAGSVMALAMLLLLTVTGQAVAEEAPIWPPALELDHALVQTSLYTRHHSADPEHTDDQRLIGFELHNPQRWLAGTAWFKNSFDQDSLDLYVGREFPFWKPAESVTFRAKLTAGALHGYRGEYRDKIPFNRYGIAPAALPSVGVQWGRVESDLIVFGTAGLLVTAGVRF